MNNVYKIFTELDNSPFVAQITYRLNQLCEIYSRPQVEAALISIEHLGFSKNKLLDRHLLNLKNSFLDVYWYDALNIMQFKTIKYSLNKEVI